MCIRDSPYDRSPHLAIRSGKWKLLVNGEDVYKRQDLDGETITRYTQMKKLDLPKTQKIASNNTYRYFGMRADIGLSLIHI